ncbi:beta-1,4-galactosyltransferase 4-like [Asterias amurensis]|uniref:beta-1,4-galactosyltransferase 4-like n=1 Tax=Asterias amurensis TaxID=7602 RepID=UPI003AB5E203
MAIHSLKRYFWVVILFSLPGWMFMVISTYDHLKQIPMFRVNPFVQTIRQFDAPSSKGNTSTNRTGHLVSPPGPVTETPRVLLTTVCPKLTDIKNLVHKREIDLKSSKPQNETDQLIFGDQLDKIRNTITRGNNELQKLVETARKKKSALSRPIMESLSAPEVRCGNYLYLPGGHWRPATCKPIWKVAILIPYRDRPVHLLQFLYYMVPFLMRQLHEFAIYVVNQAGVEPFNRAMLFNVGFLESLNFTQWDCVVMHDVDHIPQSDFNPYGCVDMPRHFIGHSDRTGMNKPYLRSFGGVSGLTRLQFFKVNGYSNKYWGWCCEDDDLSDRLQKNKLKLKRYGKDDFFRVTESNHVGNGTRSKENWKNYMTRARRIKTDGLNSIVYDPPHLEFYSLYTNISVNLDPLHVTSHSKKAPSRESKGPPTRVKGGR